MLKITRVVRDGDEYSATWRLTEDQLAFILSYAISSLIEKGLAEVVEVEENVH